MIIPIYIAGGVLFLISPHLWYGGAGIIYHDVRVFIFEKVPHVVVEKTNLGHNECWSLWDTNEKSIPILAVGSHYMMFLHQYK